MPAKRASSPQRRLPLPKRQKVITRRVIVRAVGDYDPDKDDLNAAQRSAQAVSSSALSVRAPRASNTSLARLCLLRFAVQFPKILGDKSKDKDRRQAYMMLRRLPPHLIKAVFEQLKIHQPRILSNKFISGYFMEGFLQENIVLTGDMEGVNAQTLNVIRNSPSVASVRTLELRDIAHLPDLDVAKTLRQMPSLVTLSLRGCTKVGEKTVYAAAEVCHNLEVVNLNYTIATAASVSRLLEKCPKIHTLKLAGISSMNDVAFEEFGWKYRHRLRKLKLRQTRVTSSTAVFEMLDPDSPLSLDISFTSLVFPTLPASTVKLMLTSTPIPPKLLPGLLQPLTKLRKLSLAALGGITGTLSDSVLRSIIPHLLAMDDLVELNLAGNSKLGLNGTGGVSDLLSVIGHRLEVLTISAIPRLRSRDLEPFSELSETPRLRVLNVNHTGIDDAAAPHVAACRNLEYLNLSNTSLSTEAVGIIVDACPELTELDLTGCRGVEVLDRRRFFEAWEERKAAKKAENEQEEGPSGSRGRRGRVR